MVVEMVIEPLILECVFPTVDLKGHCTKHSLVLKRLKMFDHCTYLRWHRCVLLQGLERHARVLRLLVDSEVICKVVGDCLVNYCGEGCWLLILNKFQPAWWDLHRVRFPQAYQESIYIDVYI
jgi:hypothetical protein